MVKDNIWSQEHLFSKATLYWRFYAHVDCTSIDFTDICVWMEYSTSRLPRYNPNIMRFDSGDYHLSQKRFFWNVIF